MTVMLAERTVDSFSKKIKKCLKIILFDENLYYFLRLIKILFEIQKII